MRPILLSTLVDRFLVRKQQQKRRPATYRAYKAHLLEFVAAVGDKPAHMLKSDDIWVFVSALSERPAKDGGSLTTGGINCRLRSVKACLNWAARRDVRYLREAPQIELLKKPPCKKRPPLKRATVKGLLELAKPREAAIIAIAGSSGLRIGEILHLKWGDYDPKQKRIEIAAKPEVNWTPKDHHYREVFLSDAAAGYVERHRADVDSDRRKPSRTTETDWMFMSRKGGRLTTCYKIMRQLFNDAGISDKGMLMHALRKGAATAMLRSNHDIETVHQILGHSSIITTQDYLQSDTDAKQAAAANSLI